MLGSGTLLKSRTCFDAKLTGSALEAPLKMGAMTPGGNTSEILGKKA